MCFGRAELSDCEELVGNFPRAFSWPREVFGLLRKVLLGLGQYMSMTTLGNFACIFGVYELPGPH